MKVVYNLKGSDINETLFPGGHVVKCKMVVT